MKQQKVVVVKTQPQTLWGATNSYKNNAASSVCFQGLEIVELFNSTTTTGAGSKARQRMQSLLLSCLSLPWIVLLPNGNEEDTATTTSKGNECYPFLSLFLYESPPRSQ